MSQSTLDDDELFGEAASEMREDVESSLADARAELPEADDIWETSAENVLGVLNALKSALDVGAARDHLRDAKKWFTMGQRAEAFDDADAIESEIEAVEDLIEEIEDAREQVGTLATTVPGLRGTLASVGEEASEDESAEGDDENDENDDGDADEDDE